MSKARVQCRKYCLHDTDNGCLSVILCEHTLQIKEVRQAEKASREEINQSASLEYVKLKKTRWPIL